MNNNSSKQILLSVIGVAILVVAVVGVSFAFFSYVYNGETANEVRTGTIIFKASDTNFALSNVFPTDAAYTTHNNDVVNATVSVAGNTSYEEGIKFTVRALEVKNANATIVPKVVVTPISQGIPDGLTFTGTYGAEAVYDKGNLLESGDIISQGIIARDKTVGDVTDEDGYIKILDITAYYDKAQYHISENELDELTKAGLLKTGYAGTIIHPDVWNALDDNGAAYSFKIQVTAVENGSDDPRYTGQVNYNE